FCLLKRLLGAFAAVGAAQRNADADSDNSLLTKRFGGGEHADRWIGNAIRRGARGVQFGLA
ncbi:hypothetical protein DKP78_23535, partial [Enterococcus faecium]